VCVCVRLCVRAWFHLILIAIPFTNTHNINRMFTIWIRTMFSARWGLTFCELFRLAIEIDVWSPHLCLSGRLMSRTRDTRCCILHEFIQLSYIVFSCSWIMYKHSFEWLEKWIFQYLLESSVNAVIPKYVTVKLSLCTRWRIWRSASVQVFHSFLILALRVNRGKQSDSCPGCLIPETRSRCPLCRKLHG
jgi:hypothetical protein